MVQLEAFGQGEGDCWYSRNVDKLTVEAAMTDFPMQLLEQNGIVPKRAVEIGCATGYRLEALRQRYGTEGFGMDVSERAIGAGKLLYPNLDLRLGDAVYCPADTDWADLCLVNLVFHWLDREDMWRTAEQIYRMLADGGYLLLGDFLPDYPCKRPYKHKDGLWTYKLDYGAWFVASGCYREVARITVDHDRHLHRPLAPHDVRACYWLLQKGDYYHADVD